CDDLPPGLLRQVLPGEAQLREAAAACALPAAVQRLPMDSMFVLINGQLEVLALLAPASEYPMRTRWTARAAAPDRVPRRLRHRGGVPELGRIVSPVTSARSRTADSVRAEAAGLSRHDPEPHLRHGAQDGGAAEAGHLPRRGTFSLYDEMTLLEKYNAAHAIVRRLVVKKEVLLRQSQDPGALVMIRRARCRSGTTSAARGGKITEAKVNLSDGSVFGFKNFYSHILCLGQQLGRGGRLGQQYSSPGAAGLVIQARALEISEVVLLDAELFIRYSRRDPAAYTGDSEPANQKPKGAPEAEKAMAVAILAGRGAQLPAMGLRRRSMHDDDGQEGLGAEQSDGEAEGAGMHRELAIDGPMIDGRDGPATPMPRKTFTRCCPSRCHRAVGVGVAMAATFENQKVTAVTHLEGLVPRATKVMAVTASVRPTVQPKLDAKSPMTAVSMPMTDQAKNSIRMEYGLTGANSDGLNELLLPGGGATTTVRLAFFSILSTVFCRGPAAGRPSQSQRSRRPPREWGLCGASAKAALVGYSKQK
uniref:Cyclic nucleotide-binding domain-containing protein n=1 Tax=Macrostomum lignano TaxID=282301 RepID=A0A1I8F9B7_9PLAT